MYPFQNEKGTSYAYAIYPTGVGFRTLFFESEGPLIPQYAKDRCVELPTPFLFDSNE